MERAKNLCTSCLHPLERERSPEHHGILSIMVSCPSQSLHLIIQELKTPKLICLYPTHPHLNRVPNKPHNNTQISQRELKQHTRCYMRFHHKHDLNNSPLPLHNLPPGYSRGMPYIVKFLPVNLSTVFLTAKI